jgi:hypothetical protein
MLKSVSAIALGSALLLAPALARADQSTEPPSPYTVKEPGNGPTIHRQWRHHTANNGAARQEKRAAAETPIANGPGFDAGYSAPGQFQYSTTGANGGVFSGPSSSPYANMIPGPAPAQ